MVPEKEEMKLVLESVNERTGPPFTRAKYKDGSHRVVLSDSTTLTELHQTMPKFFNVRFGARETLDIVSGVIVVRYTIKFSRDGSTRVCVAYLYCIQRKTCSMWTYFGNMKQAEKAIEALWKSKTRRFFTADNSIDKESTRYVVRRIKDA